MNKSNRVKTAAARRLRREKDEWSAPKPLPFRLSKLSPRLDQFCFNPPLSPFGKGG